MWTGDNCPECYATVPIYHRLDHDRWHEELNRRISKALGERDDSNSDRGSTERGHHEVTAR
jgi:hypothetical protein